MAPLPPRNPFAPEQAWLYAYTAASLRRRLRRMGISREDAKDLVQHAFVVALERWHEVENAPEGRMRAWLDSITWQLGQNFLRLSRHRYEQLGHRGLALAAAPGSYADERAHAARLVRAALGPMTDEDHALFVASFLEDATLDELALRFGITRNAAFRRITTLERVARARVERLSPR
ncbi:RNA polymerase sigma factor [Polyangium jinanense]|uniref:Sigma-70 family RNA polymerase sigma factor n=1 Tax=Polyangium jinanense TaxID=2829994 RepID=A0A9X3XAU7_9BACT|nr:sigma-70 family RNA polymerase sigma factor [Polyangium jinanense]MDC3957577.1 sigma-70 family RNA polymerase sigma factor [Polyangium jinanense]MDC3984641.1 sigma-70 family RNA polymerase sigma factor [Polyangium jinanense]